ncbi:MAG: sigma-54 dependent transcriptional regulator [Bacteroidales bacterium]|nr:sigma-54 dependent transcriptional regulator [Bacteroidales bacterium]MCF6342156.1 sigma-54 dependent transcriptional regulator [Bacteroidales bacterium]
MKNINILVLDDEQRILDEIYEFLTNRNYNVFCALRPSEAFSLLEKQEIDILILDIKLPEMDGIRVLEKVKAAYPNEIEVIMISGHGDMNTVIEAMRMGAADYFPKPFRLIDINNAIMRTQRFVELNKKLKTANSDLKLLSKVLSEHIGCQLLGDSAVMDNLVNMVNKVAATDNTSVLILGESGTGKELVAHGIHYLSNRKSHTFYSVNCSAVPETLFESEFFGHVKGAFTGADSNKDGWFEIADKGTLFLDEISDMPLSQQAKLLRVLEDRKVSKVGSRESRKVDVRVIAASNKNLEELAAQNKFRFDLFHRLSIFEIEIAPLRERKEDIPILINNFISQFNKQMGRKVRKINPRVLKTLMDYSFPGNIRELKNMVERAMILNDGDTLLPEHFKLGHNMQAEEGFSGLEAASAAPRSLDLEENTKRLILKALAQSGNNKSKAAHLLNITWQALDRRLKKYEME